jgi:hypothetical protein
MKKILGIMIFLFLFLASNCFAATFTFKSLEVVSDNRASEWRFSADLTLAPSYSDSYDASFSVVGGPEHTLNHIFWGVDVYDSGAIGKPLDYVGQTCSWNVTDGTDEIYAEGIIPPSVRQVALSTHVIISDKPTPNHPTVSWKNLDPDLTFYRLRVTEAAAPTDLLWQSGFIVPSAPNMKYTICEFSFQPKISYEIRIEARQYIPFRVDGTGLGTLSSATLQNRSTVFVSYEYDELTPRPPGDFYTDSQTGLDWLVMSNTVCKSPDSIKNGTDGDRLGDQGWVHATYEQIVDLLRNAGMTGDFGYSSPWNYEPAKYLLDVLGYTADFTDSSGQQSLSILAFYDDGPPSAPDELYTALVIIGHMLTGDVGGALIPAQSLHSNVSAVTIGNWLVRPHVDDISPTLAPVPDKTTLWPPNHKMVTVSIVANASDDSGGPITLGAIVSSNEPENGLGDGDTAPDWTTPVIDQTTGIITLQLRAERSGKGNGRVYTVTITATDESGNTTQASVDITVAHSQPSASCTPPPPGLTGWWPGDGTPADIIGIREALLRGDATTGPGLVAEAFILDGDGDFVEVPHSESLNVGTGDFTVDLWVFFNDTAGEQILVEKWIQRFPESEGSPGSKGWTLTKVDNNVLLLAMADGSYVETDVGSDVLPIAAGTWNHFAATRQGSQVTLFMNGAPVAQGESSLNLDSTSSLKFGHRGNKDDTAGSEEERRCFMNGRIDEVELFVGRALPPAQIRSIFNAGSAGKCKNLPAHRCFPPPPGLTDWWPGDGNTDDIIGGRSAVLLGDATTGPGLVDQAFILDGDGDFVNVPNDPALNFGTGDFTVAFWAFFNDTAGEQVLAEKYIQSFSGPSQGWTLTKLEDNVLGFGTSSGIEGEGAGVDTPGPLEIPAGTWNHFAATRRSGRLTTFVNGAPVASAKGPSVNVDSISSLKFGHRGSPEDTPGSEDDRGFFLNGRIDELQIFVGRALPTAQIRSIFEAGRAGMCKKLPGGKCKELPH